MFLIAKHYLQNSASRCHARELHERLANFAAESIQAMRWTILTTLSVTAPMEFRQILSHSSIKTFSLLLHRY